MAFYWVGIAWQEDCERMRQCDGVLKALMARSLRSFLLRCLAIT